MAHNDIHMIMMHSHKEFAFLFVLMIISTQGLSFDRLQILASF